MQTCIPLLSVCTGWKALVSEVLESRPLYSKLQPPSNDKKYKSSYQVACDFSLDGRYKAHAVVQDEDAGCKSVLKAYDYGGPEGCHGKVELVIKVSDDHETHKNERDVYNCLAGSEQTICGVSTLHFEGCYSAYIHPDIKYYGLVLDLLGPDLEHLRQKCRRRRFTPKWTLAVAIQTVRLYEQFHTQGWLHCNAKLGNFAIGPDLPGKRSQIFMLDFEYSQQIEPIPVTSADCTGWNERFKPMTWDLGLTPSRKDDLEGLAYVLSYLGRGSHPWDNLYGTERLNCKISTPTKTLFEGMEPVYIQYFNEVKALAWGEVPAYGDIIQRFVDVWGMRGYGGTPGELDWWAELGLRATKDK